jgi:ubiquinone/menaquinone biosynthesis C-methylase UbiE
MISVCGRSHNLEHFANPVKALKEWQRVLNQPDLWFSCSRTTETHSITSDDLTMDVAAESKQDFHSHYLDNF